NDYQNLNIQNPLTLDVQESNITNIIWATGYQYNFSWIKLPAFNALGQPRAFKGISDIKGLYFCGMPNLYKNKSGFISGVGELAEIVTKDINTLMTRQ
ncbi:MAG: hypothetical protein O2809_02645, partial [Proteobacteria bacterium]|nr:hypothetical protein [Pseudomonadota bacterium]